MQWNKLEAFMCLECGQGQVVWKLMGDKVNSWLLETGFYWQNELLRVFIVNLT